MTAKSKPSDCAILRGKVEKMVARASFEAPVNPCSATVETPRSSLDMVLTEL